MRDTYVCSLGAISAAAMSSTSFSAAGKLRVILMAWLIRRSTAGWSDSRSEACSRMDDRSSSAATSPESRCAAGCLLWEVPPFPRFFLLLDQDRAAGADPFSAGWPACTGRYLAITRLFGDPRISTDNAGTLIESAVLTGR
eukprot:CAMPEP_0114326388 /NCGR_PEP_ID=MMETSP0059-20121206/29698_1 /TAXON_ID=36894 /ORGANISM="Pyramimonas parkeae, Strain CCMP726" /LENGTH=140 /DNA_ID=CAMNT_0001455359 /DNA_START=30 /DNA_END=453 /DNA_ORIENTATION=-